MCVWEGEVVEYARNSTIRASSRAGSGPPNWADRPQTARALYSAQRAQCARHPEWAFPKGWPHWLLSPVAGRQSTIQARFGHPRTPRNGYGPVGSGGGAYSACGVHGFEYAAAGGSEGGNRVSATEKELYTDGARHTLRSSSGKTEDARTLGDDFFPPLGNFSWKRRAR